MAASDSRLPFADSGGETVLSFPDTCLTSSLGDPGELERLLRNSLQTQPDGLPAYYALYKLLFRQSRLEEAEDVARSALRSSARMGGFEPCWQNLHWESADWSAVDSPAHFYLFTLKALSFILLRRQTFAECEQILKKLDEIDPEDSVGASVIRSYAAGALST